MNTEGGFGCRPAGNSPSIPLSNSNRRKSPTKNVVNVNVKANLVETKLNDKNGGGDVENGNRFAYQTVGGGQWERLELVEDEDEGEKPQKMADMANAAPAAIVG